jgi:hypothetical protein
MQRVGQMISRFFQMVLLSRPISSTISFTRIQASGMLQGVKQLLPLSCCALQQQAHQLLYG